MNFRKIIAVGAVCSVLAALVVPAMSAEKKTESIAMGLVDVDQVLKDFEKKKAADAEMKAYGESLQVKFDFRSTNRLLLDAEINELEALKSKEKPTDKEKARLEELSKLEKAREDELNGLQNKQTLSEADKNRLNELNGQLKRAEEGLIKYQKQLLEELKKKESELYGSLQQEVLDAVKAVAVEKGMTVVCDKRAVLFGGVDITQPVLTKLNKKK
jgi:Skp family chaperone for outer membrane proteins